MPLGSHAKYDKKGYLRWYEHNEAKGSGLGFVLLKNFPLPDATIPAQLSIPDVVAQYPNSLVGSGLDPFLQRCYQAVDIWNLMPQAIRDQALADGLRSEPDGKKHASNRYTGWHKRLVSRCEQLDDAGLTALYGSPYLRQGNLVKGQEFKGAFKAFDRLATAKSAKEAQAIARNKRKAEDSAAGPSKRKKAPQ